MMRLKPTALAVLFFFAVFLLPARAEPDATFQFDMKNKPLTSVVERARAEKKLVFIDFFLPG